MCSCLLVCLCPCGVQLVGTRLANSVRNELFIRIIHQDVAYFDCARTGDLISRLSGDVGACVVR